MRLLILTDPSINKTFLGQVTREVGELYQRNCNITVEWVYEDIDYTDYPVELYFGGRLGIKQSWLREHCAKVYKRYAEEIDGVIFAVASENWKLTGVWGWNISNQFSGYGVQQVRVAQVLTHTEVRNLNNTVGVLYHELHHDHDTFVFVNTGKLVETFANVSSWDNGITHGGEAPWQYIRLNENQESLRIIAPLLREALAKRNALFDTKVDGLRQQVIKLAEQALVLLRAKLAAQRGDIAILPEHKCTHHVEQN